MRDVLPGDVVSVARLLFRVSDEERALCCRKIMLQAEAAHRYFNRFGKSHPMWGNGSLCSAVARFHLPPEPSFSDRDYRRCHLVVQNEIEGHLSVAETKPCACKEMLEVGFLTLPTRL
ncbi:DUF7742 family protein [Shimia sp. W99]